MKHPNDMGPDELVAEVLRLRAQVDRTNVVIRHAIAMTTAATPREAEEASAQLITATDYLIEGALGDAAWFGAQVERTGDGPEAAR
jgi:hypothetical protein